MLKSTQKPQGEQQSKSKRDFGNKGEDIASDFLTKENYKIIRRNFRSRFGEIDIVAVKGDTLIFVEVKTRLSSKFGTPVEAVTPTKLRNIQKTGEYFSLTNPSFPKKLRIEVVSVDLTAGPNPVIRLIQVF